MSTSQKQSFSLKWILLIVSAILVVLAVVYFSPSDPAQPTVDGEDFVPLAGVHYLELEQPVENAPQNNITELFWYGCPHCWHAESEWVPELRQILDEQGWTFDQFHFPGGNEVWQFDFSMFLAFSQQGIEQTVGKDYMKAMEAGQIRNRGDDVADFLAEYNLTIEELQQSLAQPEVEELANRIISFVVPGVTSTPTFIMNGKYIVQPGPRFNQTVRYLIEHKQ